MKDNCADIGSEPRQPAGRGKIARLPNDLREELNQRLLNGQSASAVLPWLNGLPLVQEILASQFAGEPVTPQNLSNWRLVGYQHWLKDQKRIVQIKHLGEYASDLSPSDRDKMAAGTATLASARIFEHLLSTPGKSSTTNDLVKITNAVRPFLDAEQNKTRFKLMKDRMRQKDSEMLLQHEIQRHKTHSNAS